jgi:hypothetical protein
MTNAQPYRIENLDVYRKGVTLGTRLYQAAGRGTGNGSSAVAGKLRETALAMVLNLAAGLGFWEKEWKAAHFAASKRAVMEISPLLELMVALGELQAEVEMQCAGDLQDLGRMIGGLMRQAKRAEAGGEGQRDGQRVAGGEAHPGAALGN